MNNYKLSRVRKFPVRNIGNQRGATLVIALIILLVMTIIGVTSMKSSTLQERMAGNARQKTVAKNAALTALREAEIWLTTNVDQPEDINAFTGVGGKYSAVRRPVGAAEELNVDVTDPDVWLAFNAANFTESSAMSASLVSRQPRYVIEYIGRDIRGSASSPVKMMDVESQGATDLSPYFFRITAIGWGRDENIYSILESTYKTGYGDGVFVY